MDHSVTLTRSPLRILVVSNLDPSRAHPAFGTFVGEHVAELRRSRQDVTVPSTEPEGLNLVALEAMAVGAIVVATPVSGLAETVRDGQNGFVVTANDPMALAAGIDRALTSAVGPRGGGLRAGGRATFAAHDRRVAVADSVGRLQDLVAG